LQKYYYFNTTNIFTLTFRSLSETLIRRSLTAVLEPGRGELHAEPHVRPISCHVASLSWQEPEEELNKRLLMKVSERDRNVKVKMLVVLK